MTETALTPTTLADRFQLIYDQAMYGLPVVNPAVAVEAVGFRDWQGRVCGVLITPWFMNLVLLPGLHDDWRSLPIGAKEVLTFPAGRYEFINTHDHSLGGYKACSLCSPMFQFADHAAAVVTATAALQALFQTPPASTAPTKILSRRQFLRTAALS